MAKLLNAIHMKTFENKILESKLIYKSNDADVALKAWPLKKTKCTVYLYEDVPCSDIETIICSTLNYNDGVLSAEELATILGFNVRDDLESIPKRYKDKAEICVFDSLISQVEKDELVKRQGNSIILTTLGLFSVNNLKKRIFYKAECRYLENFSLKSNEIIPFPFKESLSVSTKLYCKHQISYYKELTKYAINPQVVLEEKDLVNALLLQLDEKTNLFSASLTKTDFLIESDGFNVSIHQNNDENFAVIYSTDGSVSEIASQLLNAEVNEKILSIKVEWGYYLRLLNDPNEPLNFETLKPFEDIIEWDKVILEQRFCWDDIYLFKMLEKNIDANLWHEVSSICPINNIKEYLRVSSNNWDWSILSARMDGQFIVENAISYPWDFDIVIHNEHVKTEDVEKLLLNPDLTSVQWLWNDIMPLLSNDFIIKHIDNISFDLKTITKNDPESVKDLILDYPDKTWDWNYVSNYYNLSFILENIGLLAKRIDLNVVTIRAFSSEEFASLFCKSSVFRQELSEYTNSRNKSFNVNTFDLIWNDENINFFEQIGLLTWCNQIIGGFERNPHIVWDQDFFSKYSSRITSSSGFSYVTARVNNSSIVDANPDFLWDWDIISTKTEWIRNTEFVSSHLAKLNIDKSFCLLSSNSFCSLFERPEMQDYLMNHPETWTKATELASLQLVQNNISFNWNWNVLTIKSINSLRIEELGEEKWVDKWDWNYLSEKLDVTRIAVYLDAYQDYWNWSILSKRLGKNIVLENLINYADKWDWDILIDSVFTKEDLEITGHLTTIATIISLQEPESQKSLWGKITRKFSLEDLYEEVHKTMAFVDNSRLFQWDLSFIYDHKEFDLNDYIKTYSDDVNWGLLSKSKSAERLFYFDKNLLSFDMWLRMMKSLLYDKMYNWDFGTLSQNDAINWHPALLKIRRNQWDWQYLSEHSKCFSDSIRLKNKSKLSYNIKQFKDVLDFDILSKRTDITFDDSLLSEFCLEDWNWKAISASENLSVSNEFIINNQDKGWDWIALSQSQRLVIDKELLKKTNQKDWDWGLLSCNKSLKISLADLLSLDVTKWDWGVLSGRFDILFDNESLMSTLDNTQILWDWTLLSSREDLIFDEALLLKVYQKPLDWNRVSKMTTFTPSLNVLSKISLKNLDWDAISQNKLLSKDVLWPYREKLNWHYISQVEKFQKSGIDFYRKYRDYLDWSIVSGAVSFELTIENLSEFENNLDWRIINNRDDFQYSNDILDRFSEHINWTKASSSKDINFSIDYLKKYEDKWDWMVLLNNPVIVENASKYGSEFKEKINGVEFINRFYDSKPKVYHFAHLFNAVSIIRSRKILSRIRGKGLFENSAGSNVYTRDTAHHYARFYFRPQTPTQYYNEALGEDSQTSRTKWVFGGYDSRGKKIWHQFEECPTTKYWGAQRLGSPKCPMPVFFEFDLHEILNHCLDKCYYSTGNMQMASSQVVPVKANPNRLNTSNLYSTIEDGLEIYKAYSQQEFLVLNELDFSSLNNYRIICYNEEQASLLKMQLGNDPICEHITTSSCTSSGIDIFHRKNRTITISETEDSISFSTDYRDPSAIVIECNDLDSIELLDKDNITQVSNGRIEAYPSIGFMKSNIPITVRFIDLQKYDSNSWIIYSNEMICSDSKTTYSSITLDLVDHFREETSNLKIEIDKSLFANHMLYSYHGIAHTIRVMWNAFVIASIDESIDKTMYLSILYASLIHDLGKRSDTEGETHGESSALLYQERMNQLSIKDADLILEAVKYHSIDDSKCPPNVHDNIIWQVLKDADALDRSRLPGRGCNPSFLRNPLFSTDSGKEILSFAKNLPSFTDGCSWDSPVNDLIKVITSIL